VVRRGPLVVCALVAVLGAGGTERELAQEPSPTPPPAEGEGESEAPPEEEPSFQWTRVRLNGRAIGLWRSVRQDELSESEFDLENARLTLNWRPARWLRGQIEYDPAMNRKLKDAFVRLRGDLFSLRGGQFKPPLSVVAMDSRWDLPISDRGQLDDILRDSMGIVGRRPGLQLGYQPRGGDLDVFAGVFRASSVRGDRIGDGSFNDLADDWAAKVTARVQYQKRRLRLGVNADWRPAEPVPGEGYSRFWTLGADVAWRQRRRDAGWRVWGEGFVGSSWQDSNPFDGIDTTFVAGQAIGAWRHGGKKRKAFYLEPYALFSVMDPDTRVRDDLLWEAAGGVNVGRWDQLRFTAEVQRRSVAPNAPPSLGLVFADTPPFARTVLVLQVGGAF
jgi:hypothetical protein